VTQFTTQGSSVAFVTAALPKRIMLLGEKLVAFRDSEGRVGLVAELCSHYRLPNLLWNQSSSIAFS